MNAIILTFLALVSLVAPSFSQEVPILVSPQWLNDHQKDPNVVIVQVNFMKID